MSLFVHGMKIEGRFRYACLETGTITMLKKLEIDTSLYEVNVITIFLFLCLGITEPWLMNFGALFRNSNGLIQWGRIMKINRAPSGNLTYIAMENHHL